MCPHRSGVPSDLAILDKRLRRLSVGCGARSKVSGKRRFPCKRFCSRRRRILVSLDCVVPPLRLSCLTQRSASLPGNIRSRILGSASHIRRKHLAKHAWGHLGLIRLVGPQNILGRFLLRFLDLALMLVDNFVAPFLHDLLQFYLSLKLALRALLRRFRLFKDIQDMRMRKEVASVKGELESLFDNAAQAPPTGQDDQGTTTDATALHM